MSKVEVGVPHSTPAVNRYEAGNGGEKDDQATFSHLRAGRPRIQIWIFAEDVWREIERGGLGDVGGTDGVDAVGDTLIVRIKHARNIGRVRKAVKKLLKKHFLYDAAEMTYE